VEKVEITELKDQTFYAQVFLSTNGDSFNIDARPSDSIALALKSGAPIFAEEELFNLKPEDKPEEVSNDPETLAERLRRIDPEDFGKYSL